jgi:hypothetical protein
MINGGLANQLFQYIFFRYIEETTGDECILDDSEFVVTNFFNGYEIEDIFGLKPKRLSQIMPPDEWDKLIESSHKTSFKTIPGILSEKEPLSVIQEGNLFIDATTSYKNQFDGEIFNATLNEYVPQVKDIEGSIYYFGYWINPFWFYYIRDIIIKELTFPPITDDFNINMRNRICSTNSVAIHVRRGEFIDIGRATPSEFYYNKVFEMRYKVRNPTFFVFSDDLKWCIENAENLGFIKTDEIVYVDGNKLKDSFRDMQLMSLCQNMVFGSSSFSYLASLLNQNPNKFIIQPTRQYTL